MKKSDTALAAIIAVVVSVIALLSLSGCGKAQSPDKIIAHVNKEPVYASELKKAIDLRRRQDPSLQITPDLEREELDLLVNKKLVIQEAMEKGLAREDRFVNTIKSFWEQTLIRDFLEFKKKEFKDKASASYDEIKRYYDNLSWRVLFRVLRSRDADYIDAVYIKLAKGDGGENIAWESVGPIGYDDISDEALLEVFNLKEGETKKIAAEPYNYIVIVDRKEPVALEPMETLKAEIEKRVIALKERRMFEKWLKEKKSRSRIRIYSK